MAGVSRAPLSLTVARNMRTAIESGVWAEGTELPSEQFLAKHFNVGRTTIREALRILQSQGLLTGGDTVSTARPRVATGALRERAADAITSAVLLGAIPLTDLVDLRLVLEADGVAKAAKLAQDDPAILQHAEDELAQMPSHHDNVEDYVACDVRFHLSLAQASGNVAVELVMGVLRDAIGEYLLEALQSLSEPETMLERLTQEHQAILDAIRDGRGGLAGELMRQHIERFYAIGERGNSDRPS
ncbi:MAG: FCD domain-containing protein [Ilumatobacteraceae bacterium]